MIRSYSITRTMTLCLMVFTFQQLSTPLSCHAIGKPRKVDLHRVASIEFPREPKYTVEPGFEMYASEDTLGYYYLVIKDYRVLDSKFFIYEKDLDSYYEGIIKGTLEAGGGTLVKQSKIGRKGVKGIEFEIQFDESDKPDYVYARAYYVNQLLIVQQYRTFKSYGENVKAKKDKFFKSMVFTSKNKRLHQVFTVSDRIIYLIFYYGTHVVIIGGSLGLLGFLIYWITTRKPRKVKGAFGD